jgi:hypothetical protein
MKKIIGGIRGTAVLPDLPPLPPGMDGTLKSENTKQFLTRISNQLSTEMPLLKTKTIVRGKIILKPVDHLPRLKQIMKDSGAPAVQEYCDDRIKFYNEEIKKQRKSGLSVACKK